MIERCRAPGPVRKRRPSKIYLIEVTKWWIWVDVYKNRQEARDSSRRRNRNAKAGGHKVRFRVSTWQRVDR